MVEMDEAVSAKDFLRRDEGARPEIHNDNNNEFVINILLVCSVGRSSCLLYNSVKLNTISSGAESLPFRASLFPHLLGRRGAFKPGIAATGLDHQANVFLDAQNLTRSRSGRKPLDDATLPYDGRLSSIVAKGTRPQSVGFPAASALSLVSWLRGPR